MSENLSGQWLNKAAEKISTFVRKLLAEADEGPQHELAEN